MFKIYNGIFKNYDEALSSFKKNSTWNSKLYEKNQKKIISKVVNCINNNKEVPCLYKQHTQYLTYLASVVYNKKKLRVLDFGGGWGIGYANILESNDKDLIKNIDYTIYDIDNICSLGEKCFKDKIKLKKNLKFVSKISKLKKNYYDIIFLGSSLQYVSNYKKTLNIIKELDAKYILMIDVYAGEISTFCSLQKYYDFKMPHWFLNIDEIKSIFYKKYKMINKSYAHTTRLNKLGMPDMKHFKKKYRLNNSINLLYIKK